MSEQEGSVPDGNELAGEISRVLQEGALEVDGNRSVLYAWTIVIEWVAPDGERWLSFRSAGADGVKPLPTWHSQGHLHNALYDWPDEPEP